MIQSALVVGLALTLSGCNVFDPFDNPSGDAQLLSAARACFDKGDYQCASDYYAQMSSDYSEVVASELAFKILAENGATMGAFMSALGGESGNIGAGITRLATTLAGNGTPGEARRLAFFSAFQKVSEIPNNAELRGLVRFVTATALIAEIFSEDATGGTFAGSDFVSSHSTCSAQSMATCSAASSCNKPSGKTIVTGSSFNSNRLENATTSNLSGTPTLYMIHSAMNEISTALSATELGGSGSLGGGASNFSNEILTTYAGSLQAGTDNSPCYRYGLLLNGVGTN